MESPFANEPPQNTFADVASTQAAPRSRLVGHVRIFAILCVIQAGAELLMGGGLIFLGVLMPDFMRLGSQTPNPPAANPGMEAMGTMILVMYVAMGAVISIVALLRIIAALRNFQFRGRVLGFVSMGTGMLTIVGVYCFPTALGLLIYGLIIFLDPAVAAAFKARAAGASVDDVLARHSG